MYVSLRLGSLVRLLLYVAVAAAILATALRPQTPEPSLPGVISPPSPETVQDSPLPSLANRIA
ncbi:hypothetical protein [Actinokineospora sp.]|uniref:hypothetical protein n=1 Tax=Actinokineospora sp. TaxID=1872133 RepID=UPI0040379329